MQCEWKTWSKFEPNTHPRFRASSRGTAAKSSCLFWTKPSFSYPTTSQLESWWKLSDGDSSYIRRKPSFYWSTKPRWLQCRCPSQSFTGLKWTKTAFCTWCTRPRKLSAKQRLSVDLPTWQNKKMEIWPKLIPSKQLSEIPTYALASYWKLCWLFF